MASYNYLYNYYIFIFVSSYDNPYINISISDYSLIFNKQLTKKPPAINILSKSTYLNIPYENYPILCMIFCFKFIKSILFLIIY
jgi:hypothetical protein